MCKVIYVKQAIRTLVAFLGTLAVFGIFALPLAVCVACACANYALAISLLWLWPASGVLVLATALGVFYLDPKADPKD